MPVPSPSVLIDEDIAVNATTFASKGERISSMALSDPIATHLLVETALGDSKAFDALPFEELEASKKEDSIIVQRIDALRRKLAIETKVRDAASSLTKLHPLNHDSFDGSSPTSKRRSINQAELDLAESNKTCEVLSQELYYLEQRSHQIQTKLLRHTAAVLQITYGNGHRPKMRDSNVPGGRPYSPDSLGDPNTDWDKMNDWSSGDRGLQAAGSDIDDIYDDLNGAGPLKNMSASSLRLKEEHLAIGKRLNELCMFVRDIVGQVNEEHAFVNTQPPIISQDLHRIDFEIFEQLNFINRGLEELREDPEVARLISPEYTGKPQTYDQTEANLLRLMLELNNKLVQVLHATNTHEEAPRVPSIREGLATQISFTQGLLSEITRASKLMSEFSNRSNDPYGRKGEKFAQYESVINGLWQIIQAGEDETKRRKLQEHGLDDDLSPDEDDGLPHEFSLAVFSTKVQWLVAKSAYMREKQGDMRRRMHQLRDGNSQRDVHGAESNRALQTELERANQDHSSTKTQLNNLNSRLAESQFRLKELEASHSASIDELQRNLDNAHSTHSATVSNLQQKLEKSQASIPQLSSNLASISEERDEAHTRLRTIETEMASMSQEHDATYARLQTFETDLATIVEERDAAHAKAQNAETEFKSLEAEVIRLKSELTIAKAEADAAYGSRQERVAEAAKAADGEAAVREDLLRSELQATLAEFEELTRASVEAEKEREEREKDVDRLRDIVENLEAQLSEERIGKLGMKSPGSDGGQTTSSSVLRSEFKKMVKDMRTEHVKTLRVSLPLTCF